MVVSMSLLARDDIQVVAVWDPNQGSKDYRRARENGVLFRMRIGSWRPLATRRPMLR